MVDSLDEVIKGSDGDFWIEITDSQLKFEGRDEDELYPDPERVTFEVSSYARPLVPANLNFQLMPILADRGVPFEVFRDLLEADLTAKVSDLESAMDSGLAIRKWNQDVNPVLAGRMAHGVEMRGGIPSSLSETINWFVEVSLVYLCFLYCRSHVARNHSMALSRKSAAGSRTCCTSPLRTIALDWRTV